MKDLNWNDPTIDELVVYLAEIMRETMAYEKPVYKFIDLGYVNRLTSNRNCVIFGRRGSGKSVLLRELIDRCGASKTRTVLIDIEHINQKSFPNLIVDILDRFYKHLLQESRRGLANAIKPSRRRLTNRIETLIKNFEVLRERSDEVKQTVKAGESRTYIQNFGPEVTLVQNILRLAANLSRERSKELVVEEEATWKKIGLLSNNISVYREAIENWLDEMGINSLFLLLDDFYQIDQLHQPLVADYLKRLFHGTRAFVKIASVRNRTLLFVRDELREAGLQASHDYMSLELDFSLEDFQRARHFLQSILQNICEGRLGILSSEALFENDHNNGGLDLLTEASGGNPRDFINLLHDIIITKQLTRSRTSITHDEIRSAAVNYYQRDVRDEMRKGFANYEILNNLMEQLIQVCKNQNDIGFFVLNKDLKQSPVVASLLGQLVDSRFLHLLTTCYSPPSANEKSASVYVLSLGIYSEYLSSKIVNLIQRQIEKKAYPRFLASDISEKFEQLSPELAAISAFNQ